jgi:spermidine/putrescine transport system ATP-binding protein
MGMVFQDYALFPHMSVSENISYGLRARSLDRTEIRKRVGNMLELNRLTGLEARYPGELSGGQQQRVALARALVINPTVLLMDEAMGALDLRLRESMEVEVRKIQRELGITTLHVTHDQAEAMTMSDRIVVLRNGRIEQVGAPQELIMRPSSRHVAEFVGSNNIIPITLSRNGPEGLWGTVPGVERELLLCSNTLEVPKSGISYLVIRTEEMKVLPTADSRGISGKIVATKYLGTNRCLVVETKQNSQLLALDPIEQFSIGQEVDLTWPPDRARLIPETPSIAS